MTKQTIVMLHGFRGTHHGLQLIADELKEFEVIVPDLPGFSEGAQLESYTHDAYVEWVREFIEKQKLTTPPILLGHSFGSIVSSAYAAKYPKTISKLILLNPVGAPALEGPRIIMSKLAVFLLLGRDQTSEWGCSQVANCTAYYLYDHYYHGEDKGQKTPCLYP